MVNCNSWQEIVNLKPRSIVAYDNFGLVREDNSQFQMGRGREIISGN